ncbi:MAG: hypothetical protein DWB42_03465 [Chloroflexi bacterium]|nr:hypothetical protein [Chloroflexota bacterium]MDL1882303.1 glycosyltransferase family 39 protein [Anaerolineae bacterium CFX8]
MKTARLEELLSRRLFQNHVLVLVALLLVITLLALPTLTYPLGRDQGEFATIGRGLLDGRVPYRDLWNPKPPAVFYVYAAAMALFGRSTEALRLIDLLIVPVISAALYRLSGRLASRRVGLWAALVFPVFYFTETFWTLTQNDGIALLPMTLAMLSMAEARRGGPVWAFVAGALCAWAVWFKYPFALFGLALAAGYILLRPFNAGMAARAAAAFVVGGLLVGLGGAAYLSAIGAWDGLLESLRVTAGYAALTLNPDDFGGLMATALGFRWSHWGLLFILAGVGLALWPDDRRGGWVVRLWALAGLGIMLVQAKGYDYHWLPMLPPLALLAAGGIDRILQTLTRRSAHIRGFPLRIAASAGAALGLLAVLAAGIWPNAWPYLTGQESRERYYSRFQGGEFVADESLQMADFLRERVAPGDSLFIWGFRPEVYYLSGLNPAVRFIFQFPLVGDWYPAAWKQETVEQLWAALPPYVLVLEGDFMPWVTGRDADSHTLLQDYTELNNWLIFNYERETQIGSFLVWRRKPT